MAITVSCDGSLHAASLGSQSVSMPKSSSNSSTTCSCTIVGQVWSWPQHSPHLKQRPRARRYSRSALSLSGSPLLVSTARAASVPRLFVAAMLWSGGGGPARTWGGGRGSGVLQRGAAAAVRWLELLEKPVDVQSATSSCSNAREHTVWSLNHHHHADIRTQSLHKTSKVIIRMDGIRVRSQVINDQFKALNVICDRRCLSNCIKLTNEHLMSISPKSSTEK